MSTRLTGTSCNSPGAASSRGVRLSQNKKIVFDICHTGLSARWGIVRLRGYIEAGTVVGTGVAVGEGIIVGVIVGAMVGTGVAVGLRPGNPGNCVGIPGPIVGRG